MEGLQDIGTVGKMTYFFGIARRKSRKEGWKVTYLPQYPELCRTRFPVELIGWAGDRWIVTLQNRGTKPTLVAYDTRGNRKVVLATLPAPVDSYAWGRDPASRRP